MRARRAVAALLLVALAAPLATAADDAPEDELARLDDAQWLVRRRAAERLLEGGRATLRAAHEAEDAAHEAAFRRFVAWTESVAKVAASGSPTAARAASQVLATIETEADDAEAEGVPALVPLRLLRLLPLSVREREEELTEEAEDAARRLRGMLARTRAALLEVIERSRDERRLAAAIALLDDAEANALLAKRHEKDPALVERAARFESTSEARSPSTAVATAIGLAGRLVEANRVLGASEGATDLADLLREPLTARGDDDFAREDFLEEVLQGDVHAEDLRAAARLALRTRHALLARMLARRALFLAPSDAEARASLVEADEALGLRATAKRDAAPDSAVDVGSAVDDPAALALDREVRAGSAERRLIDLVDASRTPARGLVPFAVDARAIAFAHQSGRVMLTPRARSEAAAVLAEPRRSVFPGTFGFPRALVLTDERLVVVAADGSARFWRRPRLDVTASAPGPYVAACPRRDGSVLLASSDGALSEWPVGAAPRRLERAPKIAFEASRLHELGPARVLAVGAKAAAVLDLERGTATAIPVEGANGHVVPYGEGGVVVLVGSRWRLLDLTGRETAGGDAPAEGVPTGVAGDAAGKVVVLAYPERTLAVHVDGGDVAWDEDGASGSGDPVVAGDAIVVPAGTGDTANGGDGRLDRTLLVLRRDVSPPPFSAEERRAIRELSRDEGRAGRPGVAAALLGPLRPWTTR